MTYSLPEIAARFGGEVRADNGVGIRQVASLASARADEIGFLTDARYLPQLAATGAGAVLISARYAEATSLPRIVTDNPYAYYARVAALLNPDMEAPAGIDATAVVAPDVVVPTSVSIGAHVVVERGASLGEGVVIGPGSHIGAGVEVGAGTRVHANVAVYHGCRIGSRCIIHAGAVIGADGFGHAPDDGKWIKIPQIGRVVIGDDVEVGQIRR